MNRGILVKPVDQRQKIGLGCVGIEFMLIRIHANFDGLLAFGANIDLTGRVLAHEHHRKARRDAVFLFEARHMRGHLGAHLCGKGLAVDHFSRHSQPFHRAFNRYAPCARPPGARYPGRPIWFSLEQAFDLTVVVKTDRQRVCWAGPAWS